MVKYTLPLANLWNRITTNIFGIFRIITLKQQKFSQSDPVLIRQFSKNLLSDPVLIRPKLASVLIQSWSVLISAILPDIQPGNNSGYPTGYPTKLDIQSGNNSDHPDMINSDHVWITAVKCLIRMFFGYKPDWIKYLDRSTGLGSDRITQWKFWSGLGLRKSPICSALIYSSVFTFLHLVFWWVFMA